MTQIQTRQIVDTLSAWMTGSMLADDLVARTESLLAQLTATPARRQKADTVPERTDTASMTDAEVFAYYKRIALREDVRFFLAHTQAGPWSDEAQTLLAELETRKATTADRKRYNQLTDDWRRATTVHVAYSPRYGETVGATEEFEAA